MTVYSNIKEGQKPTDEQLDIVREASKKEIVFDEDCPEYSYEELLRMKELASEKIQEHQITLDISERNVEKAKSYSPNYKGLLSRILNIAINDPEIVKRAMI